MSLLNTANEGFPSNLVIMFGWLFQSGPMPKDDLLAECDPGVYAGSAQQDSRKTNLDTLNHWTRNGLFMEEKGQVSINWEVCKSTIKRKDDVGRVLSLLPRIARAVVFAKENNKNFFKNEGTVDGDFTRAVSWLLAQDVYRVSGFSAKQIQDLEGAQMSSLEEQEPLIRNDVRFNGLRYWTKYLGFTSIIEKGKFLIDPTMVVRDVLGELLPPKGLRSDEFLSRLAEAIPVIDGGEYRRKVEAKLDVGSWVRPADGYLSTSLSLALKRLDLSEEIKLVSGSDAKSMNLLGIDRKSVGQFTHIKRTSRG